MKKVAIICSFALVFVSALTIFTPSKANPKPTPPAPCRADLDGNGCVNTEDLLIWLACYSCYTNPGPGGCPGCHSSDINNDGVINWMDYQMILNEINQSCGCK